MVSRVVYPVVPPKVEYSLTTRGQDLCPALRRAEPPDQIAELLRIIGGSHAQAGMRALCFRLA